MTNAPRLPDLGTRLAALEKAVQIMQRNSGLRSASITGGGRLSIYDQGSIVFYNGGTLVIDYDDPDDDNYSQLFAVSGGWLPSTGAIGGMYVSTPDGGNLFTAVGSENFGSYVDVGAEDVDTLWLSAQRVNLFADTTAPNGGLWLFGSLPTTANAANLRRDTATGEIQISTSSRRFKDGIEDATIDTEKVLSLRPVSFTMKDRDDTRYVGFIAEEAADLGLDEWVALDAEGEPIAFEYSQWTVALHAVVQQLDARATAAEERADALERRVAALEELLLNHDRGDEPVD